MIFFSISTCVVYIYTIKSKYTYIQGYPEKNWTIGFFLTDIISIKSYLYLSYPTYITVRLNTNQENLNVTRPGWVGRDSPVQNA